MKEVMVKRGIVVLVGLLSLFEIYMVTTSDIETVPTGYLAAVGVVTFWCAYLLDTILTQEQALKKHLVSVTKLESRVEELKDLNEAREASVSSMIETGCHMLTEYEIMQKALTEVNRQDERIYKLAMIKAKALPSERDAVN